MKSVKESIRLANNYLLELIPEAIRIQLEEVESDEQYWSITLSYYEDPSALTMILPKTYKKFLIEKETGELKSMKIRELN